MQVRRLLSLVVALAAFILFAAVWAMRQSEQRWPQASPLGRIVVAAPLQILLAGGDRFLAANIESVRSVVTSDDSPEAAAVNTSFAIRVRQNVARLNPCHEDNYYFGNALLTWGGAVAEGNDLLRRAYECRSWDEVPAFFYGFNQYFFLRDLDGATRALEIAAQRSAENAAPLRKLAIMLVAGEFDDEQSALDYLQAEREKADDPRLKAMLNKRAGRLKGLLALRDAQREYESRSGRSLVDPMALINTGLMEAFPIDPMGIGYEFHEGRFRLREIQIAGMENLR